MKCPKCGEDIANQMQIKGAKASAKKRFAGKTKKERSQIMREVRNGIKKN